VQQYQVPVIRKGAIILSNMGGHFGYSEYGYGYGYAGKEAEGVADRLRTVDGMRREIKNREQAIKTFEKQLDDAKGNERQRIKDLIQKYKKQIRELEAGIKAKTSRKEKRGRFWERAKARFGVYSGLALTDAADDLSGMVDDYADWYKGQSMLVRAGILLGAAGLTYAAYKGYQKHKSRK